MPSIFDQMRLRREHDKFLPKTEEDIPSGSTAEYERNLYKKFADKEDKLRRMGNIDDDELMGEIEPKMVPPYVGPEKTQFEKRLKLGKSKWEKLLKTIHLDPKEEIKRGNFDVVLPLKPTSKRDLEQLRILPTKINFSELDPDVIFYLQNEEPQTFADLKAAFSPPSDFRPFKPGAPHFGVWMDANGVVHDNTKFGKGIYDIVPSKADQPIGLDEEFVSTLSGEAQKLKELLTKFDQTLQNAFPDSWDDEEKEIESLSQLFVDANHMVKNQDQMTPREFVYQSIRILDDTYAALYHLSNQKWADRTYGMGWFEIDGKKVAGMDLNAPLFHEMRLVCNSIRKLVYNKMRTKLYKRVKKIESVDELRRKKDQNAG